MYSPPLVRSGVRTPMPRFGLDLLLIARPWFWPVSLLPYYVGVVLATHRLLPAAADVLRPTVGAAVAGPLVWLAVLAINDAYDRSGDLLNPRKAGTPVTSGRVPAATAARVAVTAGALALVVATVVGTAFTAGTLLVLALGWAYSVPPVRLKERPGADVAVNALAIGAIGPAAGWCAVHGIAGFPWALALQGTLVGVALYLPTTVVDLDADRARGYRTIAVRLGASSTYRLGLAAWVAAAGLSVLLAWYGVLIPRRMLGLQAGLIPLLVYAYHRLLSRRPSFARIAVVSFLFLLPSGGFLLTYTGVL